MKQHFRIALLYTLVTAILLGVVYPLTVTAIAQLAMRGKANGQLLYRDGQPVGSALIGQMFSSPGYFHGRPSAAGAGYDASASSGSNLGPTSKALLDRVQGSVGSERSGAAIPVGLVPVDLVTASASGLDPDISPAAALYQVDRVAAARHLDPATVRALVLAHIAPRQLGLLGELTVNVLKLNLDLDNAARR